MKKQVGVLCLGVCAMALVACGGSSNSSDKATYTTTSSGVITTACAVSTVGTVTTHSITSQGCIIKFKNGAQTAACTTTAIKMLTGTGLTLAKVLSDGSTFSVGKELTLYGDAIKCV